MKLNLGCGNEILSEFINVDSRNLVGVDKVSDIRNLSWATSDSCNVIRMSHIIEHFKKDEIINILEECFRILEDRGILEIYCPDAEKIAKDFIENKILCEEFSRLLFGNQEYEENLHKVAINRGRLDKLVTDVGFEITSRNPRPNSYPYDLGIQCVKISKIYPY